MPKPHSNPKLRARLQELETLKQQHAGYVQFLTENYLNKLVLLGLSGQGITKVIINDIKGECPPAIAVRASVDDAKNDGQYYDMALLKVFHVYTDKEKEEYLKEVKGRDNPAVSLPTKTPADID